MTKSGFDLDEIERLRERLGSVSSAMMEGDNLAVLLCGYFDNPDQDGSDDDCGWTPDALTGYTQVCDAIHAHYAPTLTAMLTEIRELRAENARLKSSVNKLASAEAEYRKAHDLHGDGSPQSGRAWDLMRRAGDTARAALGEPQ